MIGENSLRKLNIWWITRGCCSGKLPNNITLCTNAFFIIRTKYLFRSFGITVMIPLSSVHIVRGALPAEANMSFALYDISETTETAVGILMLLFFPTVFIHQLFLMGLLLISWNTQTQYSIIAPEGYQRVTVLWLRALCSVRYVWRTTDWEECCILPLLSQQDRRLANISILCGGGIQTRKIYCVQGPDDSAPHHRKEGKEFHLPPSLIQGFLKEHVAQEIKHK